jgi:hypothetical protein
MRLSVSATGQRDTEENKRKAERTVSRLLREMSVVSGMPRIAPTQPEARWREGWERREEGVGNALVYHRRYSQLSNQTRFSVF